MKYFKLLVIIFFVLSVNSCGNEDLDDGLSDGMLSQDSELFELLLRTTSHPELIAEPVRCLQLVYPVTLFKTNTQGNVLSLHLLNDNASLFDFLTNLDVTHHISISYPITSTDILGNNVAINSNADLLAGIENCTAEEELRRQQLTDQYNGLIRSCEWKVGYSFNAASPYLGAVFSSVSDVVTITYEDLEVTGTWNFIYDNDIFYSNINFPTADIELAAFFNHNWAVVPTTTSSQIILTHNNVELVLNKYCDDDTNICTDFNFSRCEVIDGSNTADYILEEYDACVYEILRITTDEEQANYEINYFLTATDANNNINAINPTAVYNNISPAQEIYVRLADLTDNTHVIIPIMLITTACD